MRVAVTGASGLIGKGLCARMVKQGHAVVRVVRRAARPMEVEWNPAAGKLDPTSLEGLDAVIHLSGANIAGRFTEAHKREVKESRVGSTRFLSETLAKMAHRPRSLICASAVGYYGNRGDELLDERSAPGSNFLADVCTTWEASADAARAAGIRVCHVRVGIVLTPTGGALKELLLPFRMGLGGRIGDGRQGMSWIDYDDILGLFELCVTNESLAGPVNGTGPEPVSNAVFAKTLARVLHRPAFLPLPAPVVRGLFGEMGQALLLDGAFVHPRAAEQAGYRFAYAGLEASLRHQLAMPDKAPPRD